MLTIESEVRARHEHLFDGKSLLFFGHIRDNFASQCKNSTKVEVVSQYFDYVNQHTKVEFSLENHHQADLGIFYWTKNKQECQFQLYQWLSQAPIGQTLLIVGENRAGVRSVEKMLSPFGEIAKIDSARRCGLYYFNLQTNPNFDCKTFWNLTACKR